MIERCWNCHYDVCEECTHPDKPYKKITERSNKCKEWKPQAIGDKE